MRKTNIVPNQAVRNNLEYKNNFNNQTENQSEKYNDCENNKKLNEFIHLYLKRQLGIRNYLHYIKNLIFGTTERGTFAVIAKTREELTIANEKYNLVINRLVHSNPANKDVVIKYYEYCEGLLNEVKFDSAFVEKANNQVIYFNEEKEHQTFNNFVSSPENLTAFDVCKSIACFSNQDLVQGGSIVHIFGDSCCGKTHLLRAIRDFYKTEGGSVFYTTGSNFLRQYVESVQNKTCIQFQENILANDIIIIDSLNDLEGKNGTLKAVEQIINAGVDMKKYIVVSTRSSLSELKTKSNALFEILSGSISLKIGEMSNETKRKIAIQYIVNNSINVPMAVVDGILANTNCSIRELKNYIKTLSITQKTRGIEINSAIAMEILFDKKVDGGQVLRNKQKQKTVLNEEIIDVVGKYYNIKPQDIYSTIRTSEVCKARNVSIYLIRELNSVNFQDIARLLNRKHPTIITSLKTMEILMNTDKKLPADVAEIKQILFEK